MVAKFLSNRTNQIRILGATSAILLLVAAVLIVMYTLNANKGGDSEKNSLQAQAGEILLKPGAIPLNTTEIANPLRGIQYYGEEQKPPNWSFSDTYTRFCWSKIEPEKDQYDFSLIDDAIAKAKAAGYKFGWRVMPVNPGNLDCLPQYLKNSMPSGFATTSRGDQVYVPDYNSQAYLSRAQALMTELGKKYDGDPNVGLLDMSLYGCWGEWNEACYDHSSDQGVMTSENRQKLIDMQYAAFPHKRFVMLTDYQDSLNYALGVNRSLQTGVRIDCLGKDTLGGAVKTMTNNQLQRDRWKVAPLYFEYCSDADFSLALKQIKQYHASVIGDGDGNLQDFNKYSAADQKQLLQNFKASGYRFVLDAVTIPQKLSGGVSFQVSSQWTNLNTAPAYMNWNVMIQLRSDNDEIAWQGKSQMDLQKPFSNEPQGGEQHINRDNFTLPAKVAPGQYNVCVQILDPEHVYAPLALSNEGRNIDGSYCVGKIQIS